MYSIPFWSAYEIATMAYFFNDHMVNRKKGLLFEYSLFYNLYSPSRDIGFSTVTSMNLCKWNHFAARLIFMIKVRFLAELYSPVSSFYGTFPVVLFRVKRKSLHNVQKIALFPHQYGNSQFDHSRTVLPRLLSEVTVRLNIMLWSVTRLVFLFHC